ncbi:hypothetical protein [Streptomyces sp. NA02536]|uniref:hypothetical protein n=1 Tax=Streptomyces sp. NA02536 TaxID=2742133 RepID=UPI0015928F56|nr:hypothetical protein [Streptomyces sp. NA02536]QKW04201.1 hypothetical protein HUT14_32240 [Streptomyces sp. NA02536]
MVLHGAGKGCGQFGACVLGGLGDLRDVVEEQQLPGRGVRRVLGEVEEQPQGGAGEVLGVGDPRGQCVRVADGVGAQGSVQDKGVGHDPVEGLGQGGAIRAIRHRSP